MSLEEHLKENTAALKEHGAIMKTVADNQVRLLAGQEKAIAAVEGKAGKSDKPAKAAAEKPADPKPAETAKPAEPAKDGEVSDEKLKKIVEQATAAASKGMEKGSSEEKEARGKISALIKGCLAHFGVDGKLCGPESKLDAEQRKQAAFFFKRNHAGLPVDFSADYDFDGDPKQAGKPAAAEPAAEDDDLLG